ncbi:MAG: YciI family protein [Vicinamibacteria bacterium]
MALYLMTIYQPDGPPPPPEFLEPVMREIGELNAEIRAAGGWVFSGGLHPPGSATVVRARGAEVLTTDGPYVESTEHVGGIWVVEAPDLDVVLGWAHKAARALRSLAVEVRPFQHGPDASTR